MQTKLRLALISPIEPISRTYDSGTVAIELDSTVRRLSRDSTRLEEAIAASIHKTRASICQLKDRNTQLVCKSVISNFNFGKFQFDLKNFASTVISYEQWLRCTVIAMNSDRESHRGVTARIKC